MSFDRRQFFKTGALGVALFCMGFLQSVVAANFVMEAPPCSMTNLPTTIRITASANTNFSGKLYLSSINGTISPATLTMTNGVAVSSITLAGLASGVVTINVATNSGGAAQCSAAITVNPWSPLGMLLSCERQTGMICHHQDRVYYEPYFANSGAYFLLRAHPEQAPFVRNYMAWYLAHLNNPDAWGLSGTMYDYTITNFNEAVALDTNGMPGYDSSDATAGLFLGIAYEYYLATNDSAFLLTNLNGLRMVAGAALGTQDSDGLTWARPNYKVKYLEDQCETLAGLNAFSSLLQALGQADWTNYHNAAVAMSNGIQTLWDTNQNNCYYWAKQQGGYLQTNNWTNIIPDAEEQIWTILFNVNPPASGHSKRIWQKFISTFPNWPANILTSSPSETGAGFAMAATFVQGRLSTNYAQDLVTTFEVPGYPWPFTPNDAGKLLAIPPAFTSFQSQPGGGFLLNYIGVPAVPYYLQGSADLVHWTILSTNTPSTNGLVSVTDAHTVSPKYYRLVTSP